MKVSNLLSSIEMRDVVLPEFQREYVWNRELAKQLLVSLLKGYPVGGLLFWNTDNPPDLKNMKDVPERLGTIQLILDGQQRLTTLYMIILGKIPPYYSEGDIETDPRDLYYNLETRELQYYVSSKMKDDPLWIRTVDCFNGSDINVFKIAEFKCAGDPQEAFRLAQAYMDSLMRLRQVVEIDLPVQTVPHHATLDEAIDIFDRVNSKGTKLTDAELALTHVVGKWAQARRVMKSKMADLAKTGFDFDLTFMTRALTGVVTKRALFPSIHAEPKDALVDGWVRLSKILDYASGILRAQCFIGSTDDIPTSNVLVPLIVYLAEHGGSFPTAEEIRRATHWLYAASMWSRYTSQTDQKLEHDLSLIVGEESPWGSLREAIVEERGRLDVKAADFEGRGAQHPLYRLTYVLAKAQGAIDWFNGLPLTAGHGKSYRIHSHHIFPQGLLYKSGYDPDNHLHRTVVNEIANRAFLTADSNWELGASSPHDYLMEVENKYPGALAKQFVPLDTSLWKVEAFEDFLRARRELIAQEMNSFLGSLIAAPEIVHQRSAAELVKLPESATLEFKSTLQWDVVRNCDNKALRHSVLKTVAAFFNSEGGTLIVGVEDDGGIFGLERDIACTGGSSDRFGQTFANLVTSDIGPEFGYLLSPRFEELEGHLVYVVDVKAAGQPAFLAGPSGKQFFIRLGNTTRQLDPEETVSYIQMKWG